MALSKEQSEALCSLTPYYSKWVNDPFLALRSGMVNCLGFSLIASALDSGSKIIGITEESKWNDKNHTDLHFAAVSRIPGKRGIQTLEMARNGPRVNRYGLSSLARHRVLAPSITRHITSGILMVANSGPEEFKHYRRIRYARSPDVGIKVESIGKSSAEIMLGEVSPGRTMAELSLAVNECIERQV